MPNLFRQTLTAVLAAAALFVPPAAAQPPGPMGPEQPDMTIDAATKDQVIGTMLDVVTRNYVFPDVALKMKQSILDRKKKGYFKGITSAKAFADSLTASLQHVSRDKHLRVGYRHESIPERTADDEQPSEAEREKMRKFQRATNFGFERAERLPGNVGYLELRSFADANEEATEVATHAMNFFANVDALIIDLRRNGGGSPEMVQLLSSYLYEAGERIHLNDLYFRPLDETTQYWTLPHVPGKRLAGKDVYILTSSRTFSAAEEFTYNLKNLKRATIVGETTGGGAHPGSMRRLSDHFTMFVSTGRAINPVSKTNWEGTGVEPDLKVTAEDALKTAHLTAINKLLEKSTDDDQKQRLQMALQMVQGSPEMAPPATPVIRRRSG